LLFVIIDVSVLEVATTTREQLDDDVLQVFPRSLTVTYESDDPGAMLHRQGTIPTEYDHRRRSSLDWTPLAAAAKTSTPVPTCSNVAGKLQTADVGHNVRQAR